MKKEMHQIAKELADRSYIIEISRDETTDGNPIFVAYNPEFAGCMAQGETIDEAIINLRDARIDYITSLLEDGIEVPDPAPKPVTSGVTGSSTVVTTYQVISANVPFLVKEEIFSTEVVLAP